MYFDTSSLASIKTLIKENNIFAKKNLGQNYIIDQNITDHMVKAIGNINNAVVLEIGPGLGTLTRSILSMTNAKKIICIEKDRQFKWALDDLKARSSERLSIIFEDALNIDIIDVIKSNATEATDVIIIANLPYNIGTVLLCKWLENIYSTNSCDTNTNDNDNNHNIKIKSITIMLQNEVVERMISRHGSKKFGWLSIFCQTLCSVEKLFEIPPEVFYPMPKVQSAVIHLIPKNKWDFKCTKKQLEIICNICFNTRRKTMQYAINNIASSVSVNNIFNENTNRCNINEKTTNDKKNNKCIVNNEIKIKLLNYLGEKINLRPEQLSIEDYVCMTELICCL